MHHTLRLFPGHCWPASHIHTDKQRLHSLHMHHTLRLFPRSLLACLAHSHRHKQCLHSLHMHHTLHLFPRSLLACLAHSHRQTMPNAYTAYTCTTQCVFFLGHCWPASHIHTDKQRLHSLHMHHTMRLFPRSLLACLAHNPQRAPQLLLLLCHVPPLLLPC